MFLSRSTYHFLLDNESYATTGGQPVPNAKAIDYAGLAKDAGYVATYSFDDLEDWVTGIGEVLNQDGPVLIVMKTSPEITDWKRNPPIERRLMPESVPVTKAALAKRG